MPDSVRIVLICWSLQSLAAHATALPPDCQRSEVGEGVHYESTHFREEWRSNQWQVAYPGSERDVAAALPGLFPKEDLDRLATDPAARDTIIGLLMLTTRRLSRRKAR